MKHETKIRCSNPAANSCTCGVLVIKYVSVSTRGRYTLAEGLRLPLKPAFNTSGVGLKELCVCAAMFHLGHPPITTSSSSPTPPTAPHDTSSSHRATRTGKHRRTTPNTCVPPPTPSPPHHPQTSPLSLFQGAHGKPPESAGLHRT